MKKDEAKKLEIAIEKADYERDTLIRMWRNNELTFDPHDQIRDLGKRIRKLRKQLIRLEWSFDDRYYNLNVDRPLNPIESFLTWCDIMRALFCISWFCAVLTDYCHEKGRLWDLLLIGFIVLALAWLPGLCTDLMIEATQKRLSGINPVYYRSRSAFTDGIKQGMQCYWRSHSVGARITVFLGVAILIGDVGCLFNPAVFKLSLVAGIILSLGGFVWIGCRLLVSYIREVRHARQVF